MERVTGGVTLAAMLATPFVRGARARAALTTVTVLAGAARSWGIECRSRGVRTSTTAALAVGAATLAAEAWGLRAARLFGRYRYTAHLRPRVAGVPAVVPAAWYAVAVPAHATAHRALGRHSRPATRVGLGALALTAWDLFLDPQMTREGSWSWDAGGTYRGIPVRNFVGWSIVASVVMAILERPGPPPDADAHVADYGTLAVLETVAFATFWRDPLVAVVGGAAMLPLSAVALRRGPTAQPAARAAASTRAT